MARMEVAGADNSDSTVLSLAFTPADQPWIMSAVGLMMIASAFVFVFA